MAGYVAAYRIGMLASGAGVLVLVAWLESRGVDAQAVWMWGYIGAAIAWSVGMAATLLATEPERAAAGGRSQPASRCARLAETAVGAFGEFLSRDGAIVMLLFVVLYKFCDAFAGALTAPFVIDIGFDKATYAAIVKGVGLAAALIGGFAGGIIARACAARDQPVDRRHSCRWLSNLTFSWLAVVGTNAAGAHRHHHRREFHRRHRHGDLRRLSVGALRRPRCIPRRNMRCSPRSPRSGAPRSPRAPASSPRIRAG